MDLKAFFSQHSVFTRAELVDEITREKPKGKGTIHAIISYHLGVKHMVCVRNGVYATIPPGETPESFPVDPYLVASKLTPDAVLAYHTALEFLGKAYPSLLTFTIQTEKRLKPLQFQNQDFYAITFGKALLSQHQQFFGVETIYHEGNPIRVTGYERTLVDCLDDPQLGGGFDEITRRFESVKLFDFTKLTDYVLLLDNATLSAKVGFYLEKRQEELHIDNYFIEKLKSNIPASVHYMEKSARNSQNRSERWMLARDWNLMVPESLLA